MVVRSAGAARAKDLLRFLTCGSVDDGKSTLIGRLLHDCRLVMDDQLASLAKDSSKYGRAGGELDLALLLDGLEAEREQGITIDVAYRFFATRERSFRVVDTPGHERYTRNMVTGASNADLAVILVDARKGVLVQTRRHSFICSLLGIKHVVLAVNKIDLVGFRREVFDRIVGEYTSFAGALRFSSIVPIPVSALYGDNIAIASGKTPWFHGDPLLKHLEAVDVETDLDEAPFRFPVQWVNRPNPDFRGYAGTVSSGAVSRGDEIVVAGSGQTTRVKDIVVYEGSLSRATHGEAVTLMLEDEIDVSRGDVLCPASGRPDVSDQFAAHVIWMDEKPAMAGRSYVGRIGTRTVPITITQIKHKVDVNTQEHLAAKTLTLNDIGFCNCATAGAVAFDPYEAIRETGCFIIIDRFTNRTVGAGVIEHSLRRGANVHTQPLLIGRDQRAELKRQRPAIVWFTGLSGAGKSTIANLVEQRLFNEGYHTMLLDGDNVRQGINKDLGFSEADRVENIRRAGEIAKLMTEAGLIVLCSFISPYRAERATVRSLMPDGDFFEVFVETPLQECMQRDPKGLYAKAKAGQLVNFTGVDSPYEMPESPELRLSTMDASSMELAERVLRMLGGSGVIHRI